MYIWFCVIFSSNECKGMKKIIYNYFKDKLGPRKDNSRTWLKYIDERRIISSCWRSKQWVRNE